MGTWGTANFENDGARDYLTQFLFRLIEDIELNFSPDNLESDSFLEVNGEYNIIPALDMYITLSETYDISPLIEKEVAIQWRQNYLDKFDRDQSVYLGAYKAERRKSIVETFDRLDALIADWQ
jgi:hypothetical protein